MTKISGYLRANAYPLMLLVGGGLGALFSLILAYEELAVALNPQYVPGCSISPIVDCANSFGTTVGNLLFGLPNAYFGIALFSALAMTGITMLAGGQPRQKWFWRLFYGGLVGGMAMIAFFLYQSLYVIGSLCPYCLAVWAVTSIVFWYSTLWLVEQQILKLPRFLKRIWPHLSRNHNHFGVLLVFFLMIAGLILIRFRDYFQSLIG